MIYKQAFDFRAYNKPVRDGEFVEAVVANEHGDGQLEDLRAKVDKLTEIVGRLFLYAPDRVKKEIANSLCWEARPER